MSIYRWAKLDDQSGPDRSIELTRIVTDKRITKLRDVVSGAELSGEQQAGGTVFTTVKWRGAGPQSCARRSRRPAGPGGPAQTWRSAPRNFLASKRSTGE